MKNIALVCIIITIITSNSFGQNYCNIRDFYGDFIIANKMHWQGKEFISTSLKEPDAHNCASDLIKNNLKFIEYILTNFSNLRKINEKILPINDSLTLQQIFIEELINDSLFNSIMDNLVNKTINKLPKDTVNMDDLLNIAVKYFSITKITDDDLYAVKLCVGTHDIIKTEAQRKPFIEAFCFTSISKHFMSEDFNMYQELTNEVQELYKINLGIDKNERLLRAQGALYFLMRNNKTLQQMLISEYEQNKEFLPFVLTY